MSGGSGEKKQMAGTVKIDVQLRGNTMDLQGPLQMTHVSHWQHQRQTLAGNQTSKIGYKKIENKIKAPSSSHHPPTDIYHLPRRNY